MTSLDDDGSTRRDPQAGEAASRQAGLPHDDDGVRLSAPADPWLTEAPTSAISDATTLRDFNAAPEAAPPTATTPFPGASPTATTPFPGPPPAATTQFPGYPPAGAAPFAEPEPVKWADGIRHHDGRRRRRLVVAVLAACAVFVAGLLAVDQFGSGNDPEAKSPAPSTATTSPTAAVVRPAADRPKAAATTASKPAATTAAAPATAAAPEVVYEVTASGSDNRGSVSYTDEDGDIIRRNGIPLPWRITFPLDGRRKPLVLNAQRKSGGDNGPVTCTITVNGKVLASTTADGRYAATLCSGSA